MEKERGVCVTCVGVYGYRSAFGGDMEKAALHFSEH
jgi:hypothetical protein